MSNFNIGFVIFPDLTQLDFTGPLQILARLPQSTTHIVAKSAAPVPSDCGLSLLPTRTFANCPPLDLICIPGRVRGVVGAIGDRIRSSSSAGKQAPRSISPRCAPARSFSGLPDCSRADGRRRIGRIRDSSLSRRGDVRESEDCKRRQRDHRRRCHRGDRFRSECRGGSSGRGDRAGNPARRGVRSGSTVRSGHPDRAPAPVRSALPLATKKRDWRFARASSNR